MIPTEIDLSIGPQNAFVDADVDDSANDIAALVVLDEFASQRYGQLVNQQRVYIALADV